LSKKKHKKASFAVSPPQPIKTSNQFVFKKIPYHDIKPILSFTHYFDSNKEWSFCCIRDSSSFHALFRNLFHMCQLTWREILYSHQFHAHPIQEFDRLPPCIRDHFKKKQIEELEPFQFKAFDEESRIIGVFTYNAVFEIIGIIPQHKLYSSKH